MNNISPYDIEKKAELVAVKILRPLVALLVGLLEIAVGYAVDLSELRTAFIWIGSGLATYGLVILTADWIYTLAWAFSATLDAISAKVQKRREGRQRLVAN